MTFLSDFVNYLKTRTDAPPDFHLHAGMAALSTALGNRVWCEGWSGNIYPNLWIVIIAPSGFGKSVPLDMSRKLLEQAGMGDHVLPDSFSQEALYQHLSKQPIGIFYLQEFAAFMGTLNRDYNAGAMSWITALFDVPASDKRLLRGQEFELKSPTITILGASSPDWFADSYKASSLRGGFLARFLFCPQSTPGPYIGHPGPRDRQMENGLASHLAKVRELRGEADISGILPAFNEWDAIARQRVRDDCPPEFSGMRSRAGAMVLKSAMLFHVSRSPEDTTIRVNERDLKSAIAYVERAHAQAEDYLTNQVATDKDDADRLKILDICRRGEGAPVPWQKALKAARMDAKRFDRAASTLRDSGQLAITGLEGQRGKFLRALTDELETSRETSPNFPTSREVLRTR